MNFFSQEELYSLIDAKEQSAIDKLNNIIIQLNCNEFQIFPGSIDEWEDLSDLTILIEGSHVTGLKIKTESTGVPYPNKPLKILPDCIRKFNHLKYLNIRYNNLDNLPKWIGELKGLEILFIENNKIKSLPKELLNLNELHIFYYYNNNLGKDSETILKQLESKGVKIK